MRTHTSKPTLIAFLFLLLALIAVPAMAGPSPTGATIASDLPDYLPGATVILTGAGWAADEPVHIFVNDDAGKSWSYNSNPDPVADAGGAFTHSFQLPAWFVANYSVTATGPVSGVATTTFTDMSVGTYDQCANDDGDGFGGNPGTCNWINGNLQSNNSKYVEGDATVQRLWLTDFPPGSTHTVTLKYGTTKGGKHAYDFLTTWNWSENWITDANRCAGITGCTTAAETISPQIPADPNAAGFDVAANPRVFTMRGGTITAVSTPTIVSGTYAGDSDTAITVTFTVAPNGSMCETKGQTTTCGVAIWFGAHVSTQVNWGLGNGAGSISGSPYHVALDAVDGASVGQRDNQMQSGVVTQVPNGTIIIVKDAVPNDAQNFAFNLTNGTTINQNFSLDDDGDATLPNSQTFSVPPGTWTASESKPLPAGWSLTNIVCVDPTTNTTVDIPNGKATINLASNETVTCTYTNSKDLGYLKISKAFDPLTSGFNGTFAIVYNCGAGDVTVNLAAGASTTVGPFPTGTSCTVTEPTLPTPPTGWTFGTPVVTGSPATIGKGNEAAAIQVSVTNSISRDQGYLKISKAFDPKTSGFNGTFAIVYNCGAGDVTVNVAAGASTTVGPFPTGTSCTVTEPTLPTPPTGWTFGTPVVTGSPATIVKGNEAAAVQVSVTNTITQELGYLKISKVFDPLTSGFTGEFAIDYDCGGSTGTVNLAAGESETVGPFPTGTSCAVTETTQPTPPAGWTFGTPVVTGSPAIIVKGNEAAAVAVSVTNTISRDQGYLKISKTFDPKTSDFTGDFDIVYNCGADDETVTLAAGESTTVGPFPTGTSCAVSEPVLPTAPTGWTFGTPVVTGSPAIIVKGNEAAAVEVTVTNTITRDQGYLKISKVFDPKTSGFAGDFTIVYNCGGDDETVTLAAGESETVGPFPTGTSCTVTEPTLPTPPVGWTFGTAVVTGSPATITKGNEIAAVEVSVTNTISRDQGYLKITKAFDPLTSGFTGDFEIVYNCGADDETVTLAAGESETVGPFDTGTSCTVSEPTLPAAPTGWTFGTPVVTGSPATIVKGDEAAAVAVTVTNTISRDLGSLKILKTLSNPDGADVPASFLVDYNCGTGYTGQVSVAPGSPATVNGIPTDSTCTVTEVAPAAIPGYTWGTITYTPASVTIETKGGVFEITVGNSISRDLGSLKILKTLSNPDGADVPASFLVDYNCGTGYTGQVSVAPGSPATVNGIPTDSTCTVTEVAPAAIPGYTWGTITYTPASVTIETKGGVFEITVGNSISRDLGNLKLSKTLIGGPAGYTGPFQINYDCDGADYDGFKMVDAGDFAVVTGIPTGTECTVSETLPTPPAGYAFGTPTFSPSATVTIAVKDATVEVTTTNTMGQDLTVSKTADPSFTRIWEWTITKDWDGTMNMFIGESGSHAYKVTVTPTSTDSLWKVEGVITVTNPNVWDVTVDISDAVDNGGACVVTGGLDKVVPAGQSVTVGYECTYAAAPTATAGLNTATATWDAAAAHTPNGSASGTAGFGFTTPTDEVAPVVTVADDNLNDEAWTANREEKSWTYDKEFECSSDPADYANGTYSYSHTNTATINETGDNDTATVNVNCYAPVVGKTAVTEWFRAVDWTIEKVATPPSADAFAGGSATFDYTVTLDKKVTEHGYSVTGEISVTNPHPNESMTVDVADAMGALPGVVDCDPNTAGNQTSLTVAKDSTAKCTYTMAPEDNSDGTNTATVTFNGIGFTATAPVDFGDPIHQGEPETITVDDTVQRDLGTFSDDGATTYSQTKTCSADPADYTDGFTSTDYLNTASINETEDEDSASVTLNCYAPVVSKTAAGTYDERHDWTITKSVDPTSQNAFIGATVSYEWTVTVDETVVEETFAVSGVITVINPAPMPMTVALTDVFDSAAVTINPDADCAYVGGELTIPAGETATCGYSAAPDDREATLNTATATLNEIAFTASDAIEWAANVINPDVTVDDDQNTVDFPKNVSGDGEWAYEEEYTCSTDKALYADDNAYTFGEDNTATVKAGDTLLDSDDASTAVNCFAPTISKDATATYDERHEWTLDKTVAPTAQNGFAGDTKSYEWKVVVTETQTDEKFLVKGVITVVNPAPMALVVDLSDALDDGTLAAITADADCAYVVATGKLTVPANSTATCGYEAEPDNDDATENVAKFTLNGVEFAATAEFDWDVTVIRGTAQLTDSQIGLDEKLTAGDTFTETEEYTCSTNVADYTNGTYKFPESNTATLTPDGSTALTDSANTEVNCYIPTASKTATPTFTRTFKWAITKAVDKLLVKQVGGNAVFNYTVVVTQTGFEDSLWKVTGKITVNNPAPMAMSGVTVTDAVDNGGTCAVVNGANITIPAGSSKVLDYTCTYAAKPVPYSGINTATVDWVVDVTSTAAFAFDSGAAGNPTNVNKTVTVTDTMAGFPTLTLGTVEGKTTTPYATKTFTYQRSIPVPSFDCKDYLNTAKIVETNQTAQQTVKVCGPRNLGGKTIGFWSNKNGQDIIKKAGAVSGVCKLTPFLRQYAPFQDLSATASCTTVNTYVLNVIKAANASGATMNKMLKAQMLATALDVYFSDPALGGNKIGAPAPIGGQLIDLTQIKPSGNVSAAFGGATSMTVSQMLTYAASQSNLGGTNWYGQVKATQEKAKNAFDAINNNWVFAP